LGFSPAEQLLYLATWLNLTLIINVMATLLVDLFLRNKYIGVGILGCMSTLMVEAALVANFVPSSSAALQAAVAMCFIFNIPYGLCIDGTKFAYMGEIFPSHLRAKGVSLSDAMISFTIIIWLQRLPLS
jgi:hypothetical protein